jgi:hypothetical protein
VWRLTLNAYKGMLTQVHRNYLRLRLVSALADVIATQNSAQLPFSKSGCAKVLMLLMLLALPVLALLALLTLLTLLALPLALLLVQLSLHNVTLTILRSVSLVSATNVVS